MCPCTTCVHISVTLPRWLMLPVLLQDPAGHAGVTAATVLSEGRGWHEDKVVNVAADVLKRSPNWWTTRPPTSWCQVT